MMKGYQTEAGFTLIEMLVALSLLSMIALIGYQGIVYETNQWRKGEAKLDKAINAYLASAMLRTKLSGMERLGYEKNGHKVVTFNGEHDRLRFVTRFENAKQGGLYVCELNGKSQDVKLQIVCGLYHPENGGFDKQRQKQKTVLLTDVKGVKFWYFGSLPGQRESWHEQWQLKKSLPRLIRYQFEQTNGQRHESVIYVETSGA